MNGDVLQPPGTAGVLPNLASRVVQHSETLPVKKV